MATTMKEIHEMLDRMNIRHIEDEEGTAIAVGYTTSIYCNMNGEHKLLLYIQIYGEGRLVRIEAPNIYRSEHGSYGHLLQICTEANWYLLGPKYLFDIDDGELRLRLDIFLQDSPLTEEQLQSGLEAMGLVIEQCHDRIQAALSSSKDQLAGEMRHPSGVLLH